MATPKALLTLVLIGAAFVTPVSVTAAPYLPANDEEILLEVHVSGNAPPARLRELRRARADSPNDARAATRLARAYLEHASETADVRFVSYAQGVLAPWWSEPRPVAAILVARASIKQALHQFDGALADLDIALAEQPANAQARLLRANIYQVTGRWTDSARDCSALFRHASEHIVYGCLAATAVTADQVSRAKALLHSVLENSGEITPSERTWCLHTLAELARRQGNLPGALQYIERALRVDHELPSLLTVRADLFLEQGKYSDIIARHTDIGMETGLMVRAAIAAKQTSAPMADQLSRELRARFADAARQGDSRHLREEGMFALYVAEQPEAALALALQNWAVQRESIDQRLLLEAALRSGQPDAAAPVLDLLRHGWLDRDLALIAKRKGVQL